MNKNILYVLITLLVVTIALVGYLIFQNQKIARQLSSASPTPTPVAISPSPEASPLSSPSPSPKLTLAEISENIRDGVNSRDFAALRTYMTNPVSVILQATECCGPKTPDEVVSQLSYIEEGVPFNFNQTSDLVKSLKDKNPELSGKIIGISQSKEHLVAFGLNDQNRITDIRMSVSYKLFRY
ncbi:hypothetical protein HYW39_01625 [Candidatus Curtissbacteria bacterium]|nr:hypothetical protein [Candidatus Curtissbacteria bacterium]